MSDDEDRAAEYLGRAIASTRAAKGLKRMDLKRLMDETPEGGVSYPYLADIENGRKYPSPATLGKIAKALGMTALEIQSTAHGLEAEEGGLLSPARDQYPHLVATVAPLQPVDAPAQLPGTAAPLDDVVGRVTAEVYRAVEPRMRDWLLREIQIAVREELLRQRELR